MFVMSIPPAPGLASPPALVAPAGAPRPAMRTAATPLVVESHGYRYAVAGNSLLPRTEVQRALQGSAAPADAIGALKRAYADQGYFLVAVVGRVQGSEVRVEVVQGRLAHVEGPRDLAAYFDGLLGRNDVRHDQIVGRNLLAQAHAATEGLQTKLSFLPATEPGGSTLRIDTAPLAHARAAGGSLSAGNLGNRYAGHDVAQAQGRLQYGGYTLQASHARALTGIDPDSRGAYYAATGATLSRVTPVGWFQLDGSTTRYRLGTAFAPLDPGGAVKVFGAGATQLLFADETRRWSLSEGLHRVSDRETVFDGAYALRDQRYTVLDLSSQGAWQLAGLAGRDANLALALGAKWGGLGGTHGFDGGAGTPAADFRIYTARLGLGQTLPGGYGVRFDLSGQTTPDTLPSYEQWVLGGLDTLAAWLPGTLVGDRGYLARVTLQAPSWRAGPLRLQAGAFAEHGASSYSEAPAGSPERQALEDLGASLAVDLPATQTHALFAYARPLGEMQVPRELRRRQRAHAFLYIETGF